MIFKGRKINTVGQTTSLIGKLNQQAKKTLVLALSLGVCVGVFNTLNMNDSSPNRQTTAQGDADTLTTPTVLDKTSEDANTVHSFIVRATDFPLLQAEIATMDLVPTHELHVIQAVALDMSKTQLAQLQQRVEVTVSKNHAVKTAAIAEVTQTNTAPGLLKFQPLSVTADFVGANIAHNNGNYGADVTIGVLDTGLDHLQGNAIDTFGYDKYWGTYDAINDEAFNYLREQNGHGTHVSSVAGNSEYDMYGRLYGIAPNALIVGIKAFDQYGNGNYADVIRGVQWAIDNKDTINLRVLNMSFSGPVQSYYWDDPLNQAIMSAWQAGIVVVASAGNKGPEPMSIGVPGNVPYVITVGAMTDNYTPTDSSDDKLAIFSSAGPTIEGFVKPEIIAPGGHVTGIMVSDTYIATSYPEFSDGGGYFQMSGTSQAAAVISGVAALILTDNPSLSADDVKCRIIAGAKTAINAVNERAYSVFQQGAGLVDVQASINSTATGCANTGLDIELDIAGTSHYRGPAKMDANGDFYIENSTQHLWDIPQDLASAEGIAWKASIQEETISGWQNVFGTTGGFIWGDSFGTTGGFIWGDSYDMSSQLTEQNAFETDTEHLWEASLNTSGGFIWGDSVSVSSDIEVNSWVNQQ